MKKRLALFMIIAYSGLSSNSHSAEKQIDLNERTCVDYYLSFMKTVHDNPAQFKMPIFPEKTTKKLLDNYEKITINKNNTKKIIYQDSQRLISKYSSTEFKACVKMIKAMHDDIRPNCPDLPTDFTSNQGRYRECMDLTSQKPNHSKEISEWRTLMNSLVKEK